MLKLIRVNRISSIIQHLNVRQDVKTFLKVVQLLLFLLLYIHVLACSFFHLIDVDKVYVPNMDFLYTDGTQLFNKGIQYKYLISMYHSALIFGVNEVVPRTTLEISIVSMMLLFSAMVNA